MDIPSLIFGSVGIVATVVIGAMALPATTHGEYWLIRSLFIVSAIILAATVFIVQWMLDRPIDLGRIFIIGIAGFIIFVGLASSLDWVNRKESAARPETIAGPSVSKDSKPASSPETALQAPPGDAGQATREPEKSAGIALVEPKTTLRPPIVTFRDGRAQVSVSVSYHIEPANAPLAVVNFGDASRAVEVLKSRVTSAVFAALEPLSISEARTRRVELQQEIVKQLQVEFEKMGITIESFSLNEIEPM